jgi:hypothetical protein
MISAEILADSKNQFGDRLTTFKVTLPRIILAELNTHRMFSRNSASSRAIPFEKMVESVEKNPFIPIAWQKDHKGMQGSEYITDIESIDNCIAYWLEAKDWAVSCARGLNHPNLEGVTKQICNRLLEPFMWHTVIITSSTEGLENFFKLRCPQYGMNHIHKPEGFPNSSTIEYFRSKKDLLKRLEMFFTIQEVISKINKIDWLNLNKGQSEIHMMALAETMWDAYNESKPKELKENQWHIPFGDNINYGDLSKVAVKLDTSNGKVYNLPVMIAVARCARVSYTTFGEDKIDNYEADIQLYDRLLQSGHYSPFEHVARAMTEDEYKTNIKGICYKHNVNYAGEYLKADSERSEGWCLNFKGFIQQRYLIEHE